MKLTFSYGAVDRFPFTIVRLFTSTEQGVGETLLHPTANFITFLKILLSSKASRLDSLLPQAASSEDRILCEAVSIALHDLVGRMSGLPVRALLGGSASDTVPLMPCIFPTDPDDAQKKAHHFFSQGYRYLKAKLIGDLDEDVARVRAIRAVAPEGAVLQGDANEGYTSVTDARRALQLVGEAGLDVFEDPLKGGVEDYQKLQGYPGARVMVDALARQTDSLVSVLLHRAADVIAIHPDQPGSMSRALWHVRMAQSFGVPVVVGGTGYTAVGSAAYQQLAAVATPGGPCGELGGVFDHGMPCSFVKEPLPMKTGSVALPDAAGLGVELDEESLERYEQGRMSWEA